MSKVDGDTQHTFIVRRDQLSEFRLVTQPRAALADGTVELSVDRFAFTANNITYGVVGDLAGYWKFFPTGVDEFGCLPVWGFGTVTRSKHADVREGERFFGYYPMATHLVATPGKVGGAGFTETSPHRAQLPGIYNRYARTTADPAYRPEEEPLLMLYRPLFMTAFFIDDFLFENACFGAEVVVFASASSKTAYSTAFLLSERRKQGARIQSVGLTSRANRAFLEELGVYDEIVEYDAIDSITARPAVYFDMAGSGSVTAAVHERFGAQLVKSFMVGSTHWNAGRGTAGALPGPEPEWFLAAPIIEQRTKELGQQVLQQRLGSAWQGFTARLRAPGSEWLTVVEARGPAAVEQLYAAAIAGRLLPQEGHILSLFSAP
ncbi:MAG TPA: DUF2855 family protein [Polyangiaceae bacterium]